MDWYLLLRAAFALFSTIWLTGLAFKLRGQSRLYMILAAFSPWALALAYWLDFLDVIPDYLPYARLVALVIILSPVLSAKAILIFKNES